MRRPKRYVVDINKKKNGQKEIVERRTKKSFLSMLVPIVSAAGWLCSIVLLVFLSREKQSGLVLTTETLELANGGWNSNVLRVSLIILIAVFLFCVAGLFIKAGKNKRSADRLLIIGAGSVSFIGIVVFLVALGKYL